jgi:hypothetical protein
VWLTSRVWVISAAAEASPPTHPPLDLHARGTKGGASAGIQRHLAAGVVRRRLSPAVPAGKVLTGCSACGYAARSSLRSRRPSGPKTPMQYITLHFYPPPPRALLPISTQRGHGGGGRLDPHMPPAGGYGSNAAGALGKPDTGHSGARKVIPPAYERG